MFTVKIKYQSLNLKIVKDAFKNAQNELLFGILYKGQ